MNHKPLQTHCTPCLFPFYFKQQRWWRSGFPLAGYQDLISFYHTVSILSTSSRCSLEFDFVSEVSNVCRITPVTHFIPKMSWPTCMATLFYSFLGVVSQSYEIIVSVQEIVNLSTFTFFYRLQQMQKVNSGQRSGSSLRQLSPSCDKHQISSLSKHTMQVSLLVS